MAIIIAAIVIFLFVVYLFLLAPGQLPAKVPPGLWDARYAHRGLHTKDRSVPENSLAAFAAAAEAGYGIELDINITRDDRIVVFHDDRLTRVCGVDKAVGECSYEELQQYRLCDTDQRIPLFSEVLSLVGGRVPLIVELKSCSRNTRLCELAVELLHGYDGPYCIESFHPGIVRWFAKNRPDVVRGQLAEGMRSYGPLPKPQAMFLSSLLTNTASRPHFAAFKHEDAHCKFRLFLYRLLGGKRIGWVVRDTDDIKWCERNFDVMIFEFFLPKPQKTDG